MTRYLKIYDLKQYKNYEWSALLLYHSKCSFGLVLFSDLPSFWTHFPSAAVMVS